MRAAFRSLKRGGRIVVRDGLAPKDEPRVLRFLDPVWSDGFRLFASCWEGRPVAFEELDGDRVRVSAPDLYEFLTTFTWGPAAFPYEIREQRGVLPRDEYVALLLRACEGAEPGTTAKEIEVPADLASYLQPGYPAHLEGHVEIFDGAGERRVAMPDVQGVIVIERA